MVTTYYCIVRLFTSVHWLAYNSPYSYNGNCPPPTIPHSSSTRSNSNTQTRLNRWRTRNRIRNFFGQIESSRARGVDRVLRNTGKCTMGSHLSPVNNAPGQSNVYEFFGRPAMIDLGAGVVVVLDERGLQLPCFCCFAFFATFPARGHQDSSCLKYTLVRIELVCSHGVTWEVETKNEQSEIRPLKQQPNAVTRPNEWSG